MRQTGQDITKDTLELATAVTDQMLRDEQRLSLKRALKYIMSPSNYLISDTEQ